jgi:predicted transcriptional regulator
MSVAGVPVFSAPCQDAVDDSLASVLQLVAKCEYSQFPVYQAGKFKGLVTGNGITRWLAQYSLSESLIDFSDISVGEVLSKEEVRENCIFVKRSALVDDVYAEFTRKPMLEAAIITQHGKEDETPKGIVTRWNVIEGKNDASL